MNPQHSRAELGLVEEAMTTIVAPPCPALVDTAEVVAINANTTTSRRISDLDNVHLPRVRWPPLDVDRHLFIKY
jgi:hypothetical protein